MNQILLTDDDNIKKRKNKETSRNTNKHSSTTNLNDMKKVIVFFSCVILVFGIAIGGIYGYKIMNKSDKELVISKPILELIETENPEEVIISVKSDIGISKIIYTWNDEEEIVEELYGRTEEEKQIEIPYGENTLNIKVIDKNGQEQKTAKTYYREKENEEYSDKIKISAGENKNKTKLKIVVESELPLDNITYGWYGEEEVIVEAENETTMEISIDAKRGNNDITITGKDIEGNSNTITKSVIGVLEPEIEVYRDGRKLYMKITHYLGFEKVEFSVNGKVYTYNEEYSGYDAKQEELEYYFDLVEGENIVAIIAISNEKTEATYTGKCDYTAE